MKVPIVTDKLYALTIDTPRFDFDKYDTTLFQFNNCIKMLITGTTLIP